MSTKFVYQQNNKITRKEIEGIPVMSTTEVSSISIPPNQGQYLLNISEDGSVAYSEYTEPVIPDIPEECNCPEPPSATGSYLLNVSENGTAAYTEYTEPTTCSGSLCSLNHESTQGIPYLTTAGVKTMRMPDINASYVIKRINGNLQLSQSYAENYPSLPEEPEEGEYVFNYNGAYWNVTKQTTAESCSHPDLPNSSIEGRMYGYVYDTTTASWSIQAHNVITTFSDQLGIPYVVGGSAKCIAPIADEEPYMLQWNNTNQTFDLVKYESSESGTCTHPALPSGVNVDEYYAYYYTNGVWEVKNISKLASFVNQTGIPYTVNNETRCIEAKYNNNDTLFMLKCNASDYSISLEAYEPLEECGHPALPNGYINNRMYAYVYDTENTSWKIEATSPLTTFNQNGIPFIYNNQSYCIEPQYDDECYFLKCHNDTGMITLEKYTAPESGNCNHPALPNGAQADRSYGYKYDTTNSVWSIDMLAPLANYDGNGIPYQLGNNIGTIEPLFDDNPYLLKCNRDQTITLERYTPVEYENQYPDLPLSFTPDSFYAYYWDTDEKVWSIKKTSPLTDFNNNGIPYINNLNQVSHITPIYDNGSYVIKCNTDQTITLEQYTASSGECNHPALPSAAPNIPHYAYRYDAGDWIIDKLSPFTTNFNKGIPYYVSGDTTKSIEPLYDGNLYMLKCNTDSTITMAKYTAPSGDSGHPELPNYSINGRMYGYVYDTTTASWSIQPHNVITTFSDQIGIPYVVGGSAKCIVPVYDEEPYMLKWNNTNQTIELVKYEASESGTCTHPSLPTDASYGDLYAYYYDIIDGAYAYTYKKLGQLASLSGQGIPYMVNNINKLIEPPYNTKGTLFMLKCNNSDKTITMEEYIAPARCNHPDLPNGAQVGVNYAYVYDTENTTWNIEAISPLTTFKQNGIPFIFNNQSYCIEPQYDDECYFIKCHNDTGMITLEKYTEPVIPDIPDECNCPEPPVTAGNYLLNVSVDGIVSYQSYTEPVIPDIPDECNCPEPPSATGSYLLNVSEEGTASYTEYTEPTTCSGSLCSLNHESTQGIPYLTTAGVKTMRIPEYTGFYIVYRNPNGNLQLSQSYADDYPSLPEEPVEGDYVLHYDGAYWTVTKQTTTSGTGTGTGTGTCNHPDLPTEDGQYILTKSGDSITYKTFSGELYKPQITNLICIFMTDPSYEEFEGEGQLYLFSNLLSDYAYKTDYMTGGHCTMTFTCTIENSFNIGGGAIKIAVNDSDTLSYFILPTKEVGEELFVTVSFPLVLDSIEYNITECKLAIGGYYIKFKSILSILHVK